MDRVWSQALSLFRAGYSYKFAELEIELIHAHNEKHETTTPAQEIILSLFEKCNGAEDPEFSLTTTQVFELMLDRVQLTKRFSLNEIGKALRRCGFEPRKSNGQQLYDLNSRRDDEENQQLGLAA